MNRVMAIVFLLLAACGTDGSDGDGDGTGSGSGCSSCGMGSGEPSPSCPTEYEVCGYGDRGWQACCQDGVVSIDSLNSTFYCDPDAPETVCEIADADPGVVHTCSGPCAAMSTKYLETIDEYQAFDPATLCN